MPPFLASPAVAIILAELIEERTGLHYGPQDRDLLMEKVFERAVEAGFDSALDYYYYLRYDDAAAAEFDQLVDTLVVGETYLFREFDQLRVIVAHFIRPLVAAGKRARVWSAACATGEEPLTLAMLLDDANLLTKVELIASDISERALERARAGKLGRRALRSVPLPDLVARWVHTSPSGDVTIAPEMRAAVDFRRVNLSRASEVQTLGFCDVILCRNVLIYFSDATTALVVKNLSNVLVDGGALFVGVSESLLRFSTALECLERDQIFYYRKPA